MFSLLFSSFFLLSCAVAMAVVVVVVVVCVCRIPIAIPIALAAPSSPSLSLLPLCYGIWFIVAGCLSSKLKVNIMVSRAHIMRFVFFLLLFFLFIFCSRNINVTIFSNKVLRKIRNDLFVLGGWAFFGMCGHHWHWVCLCLSWHRYCDC